LLAIPENAKVVCGRAGDASVSISRDNSAHALPDTQQQAADRLDRLFFTAS